MKFEVNASVFREAIAPLAKIAPAKSDHPAIDSILMTAAHGTVELRATNLGVAATRPVKCVKIDEEGVVLLPRDKVMAILAGAGHGILQFSCDGPILEITGDGSEYELNTADSGLFPVWGGFPEDRGHLEIPAEALKDIARLAAPFVDPNVSGTYAIGGCQFSVMAGMLYVKSTDQFVTVELSVPCVHSGALDIRNGPAVPKAALDLVAGLLGDEEGVVEVAFDASWAYFRCGGTMFAARLQEGRFPDWSRVVPREQPNRLEFQAAYLASVIDRAAIMEDGETRSLRVVFDAGKLTVSCVAAQKGKSRVTVPCEWAGERAGFIVTPKLIRSILRAIGDRKFSLEFGGPRDRVLFKAPGVHYGLCGIDPDVVGGL